MAIAHKPGSDVLELDAIITPDNLGIQIAEKWIKWDTLRAERKREWAEARAYLFATDTTKTSNSQLPWNNKTTIPKLTQIRDNLFSNYMASMFPRRKWLSWEGDAEVDEEANKSQAITDYMSWAIERSDFETEVAKLVLDYIDYGNAFGTVDWDDGRSFLDDEETQVGYVGSRIRRISPFDIVFNPTATSFEKSPKIVRSIISLGELQSMMHKESSNDEERKVANDLFKYLMQYRQQATAHSGDLHYKDEFYQVDGFESFREYLGSDHAEVLTFYGDIYDRETNTFLRNHVIMVVDRHKVIVKKQHPSIFGHAPIFHVGWRVRQDNLWAMGPLDNLIGMQYRIDHLENLKADLYDLTAFPPLKISGYVDDFEWGPFERIYVGDDGDVQILSPDVNALNVNFEISSLEEKMEEMAGAPKQAMGFRTPGEKTKFEVQRLENAASRIFQSRIKQFERTQTEKLLNAMLELARRKMTSQTIRVFDNEFKISTFETLSADDITGNGRIRPKAAQHFAEKANQIQDLTSFFGSQLGADQELKAHFSSIKLAELIENILEIDQFGVVEPYVRITEQAEAQRLAAVAQEQATIDAQTPSGIAEDDFDNDPTQEIGPL